MVHLNRARLAVVGAVAAVAAATNASNAHANSSATHRRNLARPPQMKKAKKKGAAIQSLIRA